MAQDYASIQLTAKTRLAAAISAAVAGTGALPVVAQDDLMLEEVIVTATKRAANLQDIPASIQAISQEELMRQGLYGMDDYARFVPSLSYSSISPGFNKVIFRGIADAPDTFIAESSAGVYLDEQPLTVSGANVDPRMVDIERVEALAGPQGTLYGASSQSGTLRIVTNKPDPTGFEAIADVTLKFMSEGEPSYDISGVLNLPVVEDKFAVRLVGFSAYDGGFVDNVLGTSPAFGLFDNSSVVRDDINDADWRGARIAARWFVNDNWTITPSVIYQNIETDNNNVHDPSVGDLQRIVFRDEIREDEWSQFAVTIEGALGWAQLVSSTSYFDREAMYQFDTTGYSAYFAINFCAAYPYYSSYCFAPAASFDPANPANSDPLNEVTGAFSQNDGYMSRFTQEFRLSHQGERWEWLAGLFYEEQTDDWDFNTVTDGYSESQSFLNSRPNYFYYHCNNGSQIACDNYANYPTAAEAGNAWWFSADRTEFEQIAVFGEVTFNFTDDLSATVGGRWFDRSMDKVYWVERPKKALTLDGFSRPSADDRDFVPKISVKYNIDDDMMVYALYSEGFRPGGTNRARGTPIFPVQYGADFLTNYELGFKGRFANGRMQLNATAFFMSWDDYQLEVVDPSHDPCDPVNPITPCGEPWQKVVANVGNASSDGLEVSFAAIPGEGWSISGNAMWVSAELDQDVLITVPVPAGSRLPIAPEFKGSLQVEYAWGVDWLGANEAYVRGQYSYNGDSLNQIEPLPVGTTNTPQVLADAYSISDLTFGLVSDDGGWETQLFIKNLTDERSNSFAYVNSMDWFFGRQRFVVNRPREFGIRFTKSWE